MVDLHWFLRREDALVVSFCKALRYTWNWPRRPTYYQKASGIPAAFQTTLYNVSKHQEPHLLLAASATAGAKPNSPCQHACTAIGDLGRRYLAKIASLEFGLIDGRESCLTQTSKPDLWFVYGPKLPSVHHDTQLQQNVSIPFQNDWRGTSVVYPDDSCWQRQGHYHWTPFDVLNGIGFSHNELGSLRWTNPSHTYQVQVSSASPSLRQRQLETHVSSTSMYAGAPSGNWPKVMAFWSSSACIERMERAWVRHRLAHCSETDSSLQIWVRLCPSTVMSIAKMLKLGLLQPWPPCSWNKGLPLVTGCRVLHFKALGSWSHWNMYMRKCIGIKAAKRCTDTFMAESTLDPKRARARDLQVKGLVPYRLS